MDDFVKNILVSWKLQHLTNIFLFYKVSKNSFQNLTDDEVEKIFPSCETESKIIFKEKYVDYLLSLSKNNGTNNCTEKEDSNICVDESIQVVTEINTLPPNLSDNNNGSLEDITNVVEESGNAVEILNCSTLLSKLMLIEESYTPLERNMPLFHLLISCESIMGRIILFGYKKNTKILERDLCRLIIDYELRSSLATNDFSISSSRLDQLAGDIVRLFPRENKILYFHLGYYVKGSDGKRKRQANTGYLWGAYQTFKDKLGLVRLIEEPTKTAIGLKKTAVSREVDYDLTLLKQKTNIDREAITTVWKASFYHRHECEYKNKSSNDILDEFAILETSIASELFLSDFDEIFLKYKNQPSDRLKSIKVGLRLKTEWTEFAKKLIKHAEKNFSDENDHTQKKRKTLNSDTINSILNGNKPILNDDHANNVAFLLLPHFIQYTVRSNKLSKVIADDVNLSNYIIQFDTDASEDDVNQFIKRRELAYKKENISQVQPYILFIGSCNSVSKSYVILRECKIECPTVLQSVDLCLKIIFALQCDYPLGSVHVWSFFHKCMFEIRGFKIIVAHKSIAQFFDDVNS